MQKGQIIRRKLNDGTPVGPYMRIVRFTRTHVIAQRIIRYSCAGYDNEELFILRSHVYEPVVCKLVLSSIVWERVNAERQRSIIHDKDIEQSGRVFLHRHNALLQGALQCHA